MLAYTKGISKEEFVKEMKWHQQMDNFEKGTYGDLESVNACSVGCALKSVSKLKNIRLSTNDHQEFENHLGVPEWLARLNDQLFEGVSLERSKMWPVEFSEAINEGADLDKVKTPFLCFVLRNTIESMDAVKYDIENNPDVTKAILGSKDAVNQMIDALESGDESKISAAWSAARSAESAAESARSAAWSAARSAAFEKYADHLLFLIKECNEGRVASTSVVVKC